MMDSVISDALDRELLHALQIDGRAALNHLAAVLGVSENTIARRYRRMHAAGLVRVVGVASEREAGPSAWTVRLETTPDGAVALAEGLAKRADTSWIYLLSGGTEICCNVLVRGTSERDELLLQKLPRAARLSHVSAHLLLRAFALPFEWRALHCLAKDQVKALRPAASAPKAAASLEARDQRLLALLMRDGRAGYSELAAKLGSTDSKIRRRMEQLRASGLLRYQLQISPESLGFRAEARLWLSVPPASAVAVAQSLATDAEISFVALTTGKTNLVATVHCRDASHLARFLTERVAALPAITSLESAPLLRTVKRLA